MTVRAVVTGGAGFIGSHVVEQLLDRRCHVTAIDDLSTGCVENLFDGASFVHGSILCEDKLDDAVKGSDVVFHLAASVGNKRAIDDPVQDALTNAVGTIKVLEACRRHSVGKIVLSSSAGIFGELKQNPIPVGHPTEPDSPYGVSKLAGEKYCFAYAKLYGIEVVSLRYFNVYGVRQQYDAYGNVIPKFVFRAIANEPLVIYGDGKQTRDFVNACDVAAANVAAGLTSGVAGAYNIGSGRAVAIGDLAEQVLQIGGFKVQVKRAAPRPGDVLDSVADIASAEKAFGYKPSLELPDGLQQYIAWARGRCTQQAA